MHNDLDPATERQLYDFMQTDQNPWPTTARTRFVLWQALLRLGAGIDSDLVGARDGGSLSNAFDPDTSMALDAFPALTRDQPLEWWEQVYRAAMRMAEAMRTAGGLTPRTPAEEAVVHVAIAYKWTDVALDMIRDEERLQQQFDALPVGRDSEDEAGSDFDWGEVLPAITGDADVELLWDYSFDGISDPEDEVNKHMRMGDYRPKSWHRIFPGRVSEPVTAPG